MTGQEIIEKVKTLQLPEGEYIVFGSCPLALANLREAGDVDMLVSLNLFEDLQKRGWQLLDKGKDDKPLTYDIFEAHNNWNFDGYSRTLEQLLATADAVDGVPFASLQEVRAWKVASNRPKDLNDIALIDSYLAKHPS